MGASGSGKTYALRSLVELGFEVFAIFTEPGFESVVGDLPPEKFHWHYLPPMPISWDTMFTQLDNINKMSYEMLTKMQGSRSEFRQILDLVTLFKNYKCQRTGLTYGDVTTFDTKRWVVMDSLSGLSLMSQNAVIGTKAMMNQPEFFLAQNNIEKMVNTLCMNLQCGFTLTAHIEREFDEVTGSTNLMASTLGKKLAPKLPRFFDDVVLCKRDGTKFTWSTATLNVDTKTRNLPVADNQPPTYHQLITNWRQKTMTK